MGLRTDFEFKFPYIKKQKKKGKKERIPLKKYMHNRSDAIEGQDKP